MPTIYFSSIMRTICYGVNNISWRGRYLTVQFGSIIWDIFSGNWSEQCPCRWLRWAGETCSAVAPVPDPHCSRSAAPRLIITHHRVALSSLLKITQATCESPPPPPRKRFFPTGEGVLPHFSHHVSSPGKMSWARVVYWSLGWATGCSSGLEQGIESGSVQ